MKHAIIFLFLISLQLLLSVTSTAQDADSVDIKHSIALQFGVNKIKDENLHPKLSTGTITELSYGFEKRKENLQLLNFTIAYSRFKTKYEDLSKSINLGLSLSYSYNFQISKKSKFTYWLGPEANLEYNACYFPNWDDSHLYWANYLSLGVKNVFSFDLKNDKRWISSLSFPLFSVFSRPDLYRLYKIDETDFAGIVDNLHSNITAAHLVNVFYVKFQTEIRFPVFKTKQEALFYSFEWIRVKHDEGNPFQQLSHQIGIKFLL